MVYVPPKYPGEIPTENNLFPWEDDTHYVSVEKFTAFMKELRAALIELGTDPAGAYDTVAAFLTALNTDKITGAQVPENETDPSVDASLKGITLIEVRDHPAVFPAGIIAMWSGTLGTIPEGWALCDGGGGRPDLRDKFVMGAAASANPGATGGAITHATPAHAITIAEMPAHTHPCDTAEGIGEEVQQGEGWPLGIDTETGSRGGNAGHGHTAANHLPPYYKIAYIIKT